MGYGQGVGKIQAVFNCGCSVYKLGVLPWLVPQGTINQQGSRPDGGQEEAFCRFCHAKAVPEWVLGKEGVKAQELVAAH